MDHNLFIQFVCIILWELRVPLLVGFLFYFYILVVLPWSGRREDKKWLKISYQNIYL